MIKLITFIHKYLLKHLHFFAVGVVEVTSKETVEQGVEMQCFVCLEQ